MIFTLYYMYATFVQWWRLGALRNKLRGTLNHQNALVVSNALNLYDVRDQRSLENLLFQNDDRVVCTIVPKQTVNLSSQWVGFPKDARYFPIFVQDCKVALKPPSIYVLLQAFLSSYVAHETDLIQIENFGEPIAWKANDNFEVILKTDFENLTKLVHCFSKDGVDINHELRLLRLETVEVEGAAEKIKYDTKYTTEDQLKYSHAPVHWKKFVENLQAIYFSVRDAKNPKIKIENGTIADDGKKVPIYEVKPMKKDKKRFLESSDSKNKLEVSTKTHTKTKESSHHRSKKPDEKEAKVVKREHKPHKKEGDKVKKVTTATTKVEEVNGGHVLHEDKSGFGRNVTKYGKDLKRNVKPPVVLVFADSAIAKDGVKTVLHEILNREKYTVYDFPQNSVNINAWSDCTQLVVVCGNVPPNLTNQLLQFLVNGGHLLCLCSDLLYSVLNTFTTAEVREHELVRFTYGDWKRVKMMHHIFCYQASPAKKQFSKDSDQSSNHSSSSSSPVAPKTPSTVDIQHNGKTYTIQVQVLGAEETWQTPSLLLATVKGSSGQAVFSQVHLEIDPNEYEDDEDKFAALKESNNARLEILRHILSERLGMDCQNVNGEVQMTPGYFLGRHDLKLQLLNECDSIVDKKLITDTLTVTFCGKEDDPGNSTESHLPVMVHSCPSNFSTVQYFETLNTEELGRLVIYVDALARSKPILDKKLKHGLVVIPRILTKASGRNTNQWISTKGSAMFSLQMHIPLASPLGKTLPLVQHMCMVGVVSAIRSLPGYEKLGLGVKWPNDLYTTLGVKVGGLVVTTTTCSELAIANIGVGVDLDNANPTMCINELIRLHNEEFQTYLEPIPYERFFAIVFNELERIYKTVQAGDLDYLYDLYYKYWLHGGAHITVLTKTGETRKAIITGLDDYGFLTVRTEDGSLSSVQPDGNTFDMMKGLIAPKIF